ncbi:hypothetical protein [Oscillibacter sp.]|uniref:hypothetical protein n=1 Tax=Oscillibacter sp. TaxID=1945593 RepID=UPI0028B0916E|nr:hypothetical protein [Oscillibacter sp.]
MLIFCKLRCEIDDTKAATTLDIYTHSTDDIRHSAAANIGQGIGKCTSGFAP